LLAEAHAEVAEFVVVQGLGGGPLVAVVIQ